MYQDILYPTDGSDGATAASEVARDLAETYGATVHVIHVVDERRSGGGMVDDHQAEDSSGMSSNPEGEGTGMAGSRTSSDEMNERQSERARQVVEEAAASFEGVETETVVSRGTPHEVIIEYAHDETDGIVMGTHGRTGLDRYLLGSVAEKVVRLSDVPVTTVRRDD